MESISTTLFSLYRNTPFHEAWMVACLEGAWPKLVGDGIGRACRPVEMRGRTLVIEVCDPAWSPVLVGMERELLQRFKAAAGDEVQRLLFVLSPGTRGPS